MIFGNLAKNLSGKQFDTFWSNIRKCNNNKVSEAVNTINGCSGNLEIFEMWKKHFAALYNSVDDKGAKDTLLQRILQHQDTEDSDTYVINVQDVASYCSKQKKGKAIGLDGIAMEALI